MNQCPKCGKVSGLHSSILPGCMCEWSMQAMKEGKDFTISKPWVGLTEEEISEVLGSDIHLEQSGELRFIRAIEAKLKEKNNG